MKKLLLCLLIIGPVASAHAMFKGFSNLLRPSLANCYDSTAPDSASSSAVASSMNKNISIEPFNFEKYKEEISKIYYEAFPACAMAINSSSQGYMLLSDGVLKGFIVIEDYNRIYSSSSRYVELFAIDASSRKTNLGTLLWNHMVKDTENKNIQTIALRPRKTAIPFYEKKGLFCTEQCQYMIKQLKTQLVPFNPQTHSGDVERIYEESFGTPISQILSDPSQKLIDKKIVVLEQGQTVIGLLVYYDQTEQNSTTRHIDRVAIDSYYAGRYFGTHLIKEFEAQTINEKSSISSITVESFRRTVPFYTKLEYRCTDSLCRTMIKHFSDIGTQKNDNKKEGIS